MKRLSALFLVLAMALTLAGCGDTSDPGTGGGSASSGSQVSTSMSGSGSGSGSGSENSSDSGNLNGSSTSEDASAGNTSESSSAEGSNADPSASGSYDNDPLGPAREDLPVEGEYYYDLEHVVVYLDLYGELPDNYITKKEAQALGWSGGSVENYKEGAAIGGDHFGNREGILPDGNYTECDLNTDGMNSRGAERLVFSDDGEYYYTEDHYESFTQVWVENGEVLWDD